MVKDCNGARKHYFNNGRFLTSSFAFACGP